MPATAASTDRSTQPSAIWPHRPITCLTNQHQPKSIPSSTPPSDSAQSTTRFVDSDEDNSPAVRRSDNRSDINRLSLSNRRSSEQYEAMHSSLLTAPPSLSSSESLISVMRMCQYTTGTKASSCSLTLVAAASKPPRQLCHAANYGRHWFKAARPGGACPR